LDGKYELVVAGRDTMYVYAFIGEQYAGWPQPLIGGLTGIYGNSLPTVGDVDGRGFLEVAAIDRNGAIHVWHEDGSAYGDDSTGVFDSIPVTHARSNALPQVSICDLDRDGNPELIAAGDEIRVFDGRTRGPYHGNPEACIAAHYSVHALAIADFDDDHARDIVYVAADGARSPFLINVVDVGGQSLPGWPRELPVTMDQYILYSLAVGDVDGDGRPEVFAAPYSLGEGFLYAFHADGTPLGSDSTDGCLATLSGSASPVSLVDIDGDGDTEIALRVGELLFGPDWIVAYEIDGTPVPGFPLLFGYGSSPIIPPPVVGDINGDGRTDMVTVQSTSTNVAVWELGTPAGMTGRPWPRFRGDLWNSGVAISPYYDVLYLTRLINMLLRRGTPLPPYELSDLDGNGKAEIADVVLLVNYLFRGGPAPVAP
jgi:hypothetical protein